MLEIEKIYQRCEARYKAQLKAWGELGEMFPLRIPLGKITSSLNEVSRWGVTLQKSDAEHQTYGYTILRKKINSTKYGQNHFPTHVEFSSAEHLAGFLDKSEEWGRVKICYENIARVYPSILNELKRRPSILLQISILGDDFFRSIEWMIEHPNPGCFLREIPALPHSKFVEDHVNVFQFLLDRLIDPQFINKDEDQFERKFGYQKLEHFFVVRLLDDSLLRSFNFPFEELAIHPRDLNKIDAARVTGISQVIIVENQVNLHTLPKISGTIAIHGHGYALARLKTISWLKKFPIYYWGDIDVFGYEILHELRRHYPDTRSIMMEPDHIRQLKFVMSEGKPSTRLKNDLKLTQKEKVAHRWCRLYNKRIEQERIPIRMVEVIL